MYVTICEQDNLPTRVFCTIVKSVAAVMAKAEAIGRLVSLALKYKIPIEEIVEQLIDIGSNEASIAWHDTVIKSIPDAVGKVLKERYLKGE